MGSDALHDLAVALQDLCIEGQLTVATAESCTGGMVADTLTDIPGSSRYLVGGVVAYSDRVKEEQLGVPAELIRLHGAVSAQVARAMAIGARGRLSADLAVAITGIAGPDGGTDAKPVGLAYVAVAGPRGVDVRRHAWRGDRLENKAASVRSAIEMLQAAAAALSTPGGAGVASEPDRGR